MTKLENSVIQTLEYGRKLCDILSYAQSHADCTARFNEALVLFRELTRQAEKKDMLIELTKSELKQIQERNDFYRRQIQAIHQLLDGKVCDPDPVKPIFEGSFLGELTPYGLVAGLLRERDELKNLMRARDQK